MIKIPRPPERSWQAVREGIADLLEADPSRSELIGAGGETSPMLTAPHRSYVLALADLINDKGVGAAHPTGWRFLVRDGDRFLGVGETEEVSQAESDFAQFDSASLALRTAGALREVEARATSLNQDFEVRYLRIPEVLCSGLWLHGVRSDLLMILETARPRPQAADHDLVEAEEYLRALADEVRAEPVADDDLIGGSL